MTPATRDRLGLVVSGVNLVTLVAAVAVLWWRVERLEQEVSGLSAAVGALQLDVARLTVER